jgi:hypothetical protein
MKKFFSVFLTFLLAFFVVSINAQVKLGLQAGINLADVNVDPLPEGTETSMRTRFIAGGILNYNFSPLLSLQIEPAYVQKGASADISGTQIGGNFKAEGTYSADYIDIPVLLKASFGNPQIKPFLLAGISAAFLLGDVKINIDKYTLNGQDVTSQLPSDIKEQTQKGKSTDFILDLGGGVLFPLGQVELFIEGQYNLGLTNVNDEPNDDTKIKTRGIQIKVGALFPL